MTLPISPATKLTLALRNLPITGGTRRDEALKKIAEEIDRISPTLNRRELARVHTALRVAYCTRFTDLSKAFADEGLPWFESTGRLAATEEFAHQAFKISSQVPPGSRDEEELGFYKTLNQKTDHVALSNISEVILGETGAMVVVACNKRHCSMNAFVKDIEKSLNKTLEVDLPGTLNRVEELRTEYWNLCNDPEAGQADRAAFEKRRSQFRHEVLSKINALLCVWRNGLVLASYARHDTAVFQNKASFARHIAHLTGLVRTLDQIRTQLEVLDQAIDGRRLLTDYTQAKEEEAALEAASSATSVGAKLKKVAKVLGGFGVVAASIAGLGFFGIKAFDRYKGTI